MFIPYNLYVFLHEYFIPGFVNLKGTVPFCVWTLTNDLQYQSLAERRVQNNFQGVWIILRYDISRHTWSTIIVR